MSSASCLLSEDQFLCSICMDVFTDPVTTPCGHNFCKKCITKYWSIKVPCKCPNCKETFRRRPELKVNTFISEMAAQFRQSTRYGARRNASKQKATKTEDVPCDFCTEAKSKALKSCLVCLASYCETHLEPHQKSLDLQGHKLIDPVVNLDDWMCDKHNRASSNGLKQKASKPGEVPCDFCTGAKSKALKSCLVCLASYCETHLESHLVKTGLKKHQLIDPVENLEDRMCEKHDKLLELFCKNDQMCVCILCSDIDHETHDVVPLKEEYEGKKAELGKTEAEVRQMIQKRQMKIQEIKHSVKISKKNADKEIAEGVQVFTNLKKSVERSQAELIDSIKEKQRETEKQAEGFIKELEQEISELEKRRAEVEQLSRSEDHLQLLQNFTSLSSAPPTKDWTEVRVHPPSYEGTVVRVLKQLEETMSKLMKNLLEAELKRVQQYEVDVTLDPDTAQSQLDLSDDGKQIYHSGVERKLPDTPQRFDPYFGVLSKQSFSTGRFYYEVQVKGKTDWVVGVARESIDRKGVFKWSPQKGYWTICLSKNKYKACIDPNIRLSLKSALMKVGVFVDYEEGLVSFYDPDAATLIYSFTGCSFNQKIYPLIGPCWNNSGQNSAPLIISRHSD